jgi:hypothetical protein
MVTEFFLQCHAQRCDRQVWAAAFSAHGGEECSGWLFFCQHFVTVSFYTGRDRVL